VIKKIYLRVSFKEERISESQKGFMSGGVIDNVF
jgi:hypothetical protein